MHLLWMILFIFTAILVDLREKWECLSATSNLDFWSPLLWHHHWNPPSPMQCICMALEFVFVSLFTMPNHLQHVWVSQFVRSLFTSVCWIFWLKYKKHFFFSQSNTKWQVFDQMSMCPSFLCWLWRFKS